MRIQCNLLPFFLLGLVVTSMVEASRKKGHKRKRGKKVKQGSNHSPPSSTLDDDSAGAENEVPVSQAPTGQSGKGSHNDNGSLFETSNHRVFSIDDPYGSLPSTSLPSLHNLGSFLPQSLFRNWICFFIFHS